MGELAIQIDHRAGSIWQAALSRHGELWHYWDLHPRYDTLVQSETLTKEAVAVASTLLIARVFEQVVPMQGCLW